MSKFTTTSYLRMLTFILVAFISYGYGIYSYKNNACPLQCIAKIKHAVLMTYNLHGSSKWPDTFSVAGISSSYDGVIQKLYYHWSDTKHRPLIVSLHSWSGDYKEPDNSLAYDALSLDYNYIHPDFRGANNNYDACCGDKVLADIDGAIDYAIKASNCDSDHIYVIGASGGAYAALCAYMMSKHAITAFYVWCPISDLTAWYKQSIIRHNGYASDIMKCTNSVSTLDMDEARKRSPLFMNTPVNKRYHSSIHLFAGIRDGYDGVVPITHSIHFYNKLINDLGCSQDCSVSTDDILYLLERADSPMKTHSKIGNRDILYFKGCGNITLTIFDGAHEMLSDAVSDALGR